jgi:predicted GNAT superfamily acetyltransferase
VNFYGEATSSPLHTGFGTDRLWVSWLLSSDRVQKRIDRLRDKDLSPHETEPGVETITSLPLLVRAQGERPELADLKSRVKASACLIEIPYNITALKKINAEAALAWREATRAAFLAALESGLTVEDFIVTDEQNLPRWFYKLTR